MPKRNKSFLRDHSLSIVFLGAFFLFWAGQSFVGHHHDNDERKAHGQPPVTYAQYVTSSDFLEATFENWESEFFQMGALVILAAFLRQRGSGESQDPDKDKHEEDGDLKPIPGAPWAVLRGGWVLKVYSHSLSLALFGLFLICFVLHAFSSAAASNEEARLHGQPEVTVLRHAASSTFWFESLQNWQSEFLSVGALVLLSVWLREKGSPESKPVNAPHSKTGK
ncbi:hypothetical protein G4177_10145 [Corallococcus sp. ZKHCc1 1396]|uniref:Transmembrane protein n=1 Tax=Corallococcus soli TaxID=2710757 RepID=A0ABR9PKW0_9BACT|nr:hypothetical protein [Corallococcus soli]